MILADSVSTWTSSGVGALYDSEPGSVMVQLGQSRRESLGMLRGAEHLVMAALGLLDEVNSIR